MSRPDLIRDLRERIGQIERSQRFGREAGRMTTGVEALDQLLPGGGLEGGTLIEWLSAGEGSGTATLALAVAARVLEQGGVLVVIDERGEFYPPAVDGLGIPLEQTVVVQPGTTREALWALEQSLRSRAVAVALGWLDRLHEHAFRRLQLAAETGGGLGFLLRPITCRAAPSWAEARLLVSALPSLNGGNGGRGRVFDAPAGVSQTKSWPPTPSLNGGNGTTATRLARSPFDSARSGDLRRAPSPSLNGNNGDELQRLLSRPRQRAPSLNSGNGDLAGFQSLGRRLRVELLHCRGGVGGGAIELELSDEADPVHVAPQLADPAALRRRA